MFTSYEITGAFKISNNWFTPIQLQNINNIILTSESILKNRILTIDKSLSESFIGCEDLTNIDCIGSIETFLHFNKDENNFTIESLFNCAMGSENLTFYSPEISNRVLKLSNNIYGKFGTLAFNKILTVHEFASVKVDGFSISGNIGELLKLSFYVISNNRKIDSIINTLVNFKTIEEYQLLHADEIIPITLNYGSFYIDDYNDSISTEYSISSFNFNFRRNLESDFVANKDNLNETLEPMGIIEDGRILNFEVKFDYYDTLEFIEDFDLQTFKHAILEFIGPEIYIDGNPSGYRFTFKIKMNKMKIINQDDIINNAGLAPLTLKFDLLDDNTNKPFEIEIVSTHIQAII